ncbi:Vacuolar protein sorting-associated protein 54 [Sciurus carolinensis]|uniref:Vacuolar protein sorting-associated protein 54 n=1 Tax=Sciurus carolinensis TaxID=30640 RepID=A0AA41SVM6_SCICA|nr:Vacuolar protein sorting-associated protein 54 [Sciurus carolinensis]
MASSHSSSPVPQGSSSDVFFKKEVDPTKHIRPVQSLPDVCPKEPTDKSRTDLEQVPKIFMKPDFALDDSLTFNSVLPWSHFNTAGGKGNRDAASSKLLQEKEFKQLTSRLLLLPTARSPWQSLGVQVTHPVPPPPRVTPRPSDLLRFSSSSGQPPVFRSNRSESKQLATQLLLRQPPGAPVVAPSPSAVLSSHLYDVPSCPCLPLQHLGSQLCELEKLIDKMMIAEFSTYSHSDLNRPLEDDCQVLEEERLVSLVFGLLKQRKLNFLEIYGEEMIITAKNIIKQCVINKVSQIEEIDTDVVMKLADQMRMLNFPQWFDLLKDIFSKFKIFLQRVKATLNIIHNVVLSVLDKNQRTRELEEISQQKNAAKDNSLDTEVAYLIHEGMFISDAFSEGELTPIVVDATSQRNASPNSEPCSSDSVSEPECTTDSSSSKEQTSSSATPGGVDIIISEDMKLTDLELGKLANNIQELLYSASDICHDRAVKFLMSRAKDGFLEKLNSTEFITLSRSMETFILETEQICGRKSTSLLGALQSQANKFVNRFHEERKTKLSLLLDNERWKQADVPAEFQDLVDSISDGKIALPEKKSGEERKPAEVLIVEGQQYAVVGTVLLLIRIILEYCQCVDNIPSVTTDMLTRLSDLLKLIVHYIPVIRAHFEARLPPKQYNMLRHFDHITKDYHDHIAEISAKLVAIMDSLFDKLLSKYEVKAPVPSACFRNICKQMAKMHEAIFDLLPEEQTQMLFLRINTSYKLHLKKQLSHLNVINDGGPQNGLVTADVAFYTGNLQALKGLKDLDLNMAEIWEQKR